MKCYLSRLLDDNEQKRQYANELTVPLVDENRRSQRSRCPFFAGASNHAGELFVASVLSLVDSRTALDGAHLQIGTIHLSALNIYARWIKGRIPGKAATRATIALHNIFRAYLGASSSTITYQCNILVYLDTTLYISARFF